MQGTAWPFALQTVTVQSGGELWTAVEGDAPGSPWEGGLAWQLSLEGGHCARSLMLVSSPLWRASGLSFDKRFTDTYTQHPTFVRDQGQEQQSVTHIPSMSAPSPDPSEWGRSE